MKILHIYDIAGIGKILSKELMNNDIMSYVITRKERDLFKFGEYYKDQTIYTEGRVRKFFIETLKIIKKLNPDILHFHGLDRYLHLFKIRYPKKKVIIHYHGGDIRNQWEDKKNKFIFSDLVVVATPDLLKGIDKNKKYSNKIIHVPNPIDREFFKRTKPYKKGSCLYIRQHFNYVTQSEKIAIKFSEKNNLDLTILDRNKIRIPYNEFKSYLEDFEYFIDVKHGRNLKKYNFVGESEILKAFSTTGLQQLSLEGKIFHDYKTYSIFPYKHDSKYIIKTWVKIYDNLINR